MVSVDSAQVLRSWSCATLAFVQAEPPRRPWQVLTGNEAGGLLLEQNGIPKFMWIHFRSQKGTTGKKCCTKKQKSPLRVQFQGSAVWGCGEQCES